MVKCSYCGVEKPESNFAPSRLKKGERRCGSCKTAYNKKYYAKNRKALIKYAEQYREENRDAVRQSMRISHSAKRIRQKASALERYGKSCRCCGEKEKVFLCIDHLDGKGGIHRKEVLSKSGGIYNWLEKNGYPRGFQVLCHNCNWAKHVLGVCPHKAPEGSTTIPKGSTAKRLEARSPS